MTMITVVIPVINEEANLRRCLISLKNNKCEFETIVVDGGSDDDTLNVAKEFGAHIIFDHGRGPAAARNLGWRAAKGNIIYLIDADVQVSPKTLDHVSKYAEKNPDVETIGISRSFNTPTWVAKAVKSENEIFEKNPTERALNAPRFFRKSLLEKIDGFNEKLGFGEDREMGARLHNLNYLERHGRVPEGKEIHSFVESLPAVFAQGRWYGHGIIPYTKITRDLRPLLYIFFYASPLGLLSLLKLPPSLWLVKFTRSWGEIIGILESPFRGLGK